MRQKLFDRWALYKGINHFHQHRLMHIYTANFMLIHYDKIYGNLFYTCST
jgi:hypothetical protein